MTREDKELLLKDLCARLPYGVICKVCDANPYIEPLDITTMYAYNVQDITPYLRPMSSMTEEEKKEYYKTFKAEPYGSGIGFIYVESAKSFDWLNKHHFDYRGLIPKGLAVSTDVFNPYKD